MTDYADLDMLHAYGGFTNPSEENDALLESLISTASTMIESFCGGRIFAIADGAEPTAHTFTRDNGLPSGSKRSLWLDADLCSTPTITDDPVVTLIPRDPPYYRIVREEGAWPDPTVVTGHWAYSMTPPAPIVHACLRLAIWMYHQRESTDGDRPMVTPSGIFLMPNALPRDIQTILIPYKQVRCS